MKRKRLLMVYTSAGLLVLLAIVVMIERFGIRVVETEADHAYMPQTLIDRKKDPEELEKESLVIIDQEEVSNREEQLVFVLESMDVGYDLLSVSELASSGFPELTGYNTVILNTTQTEVIAESGWLDELMQWVENGGRLWSVVPDVNSAVFTNYQEAFGISAMTNGTVPVSAIDMVTDFMIGSNEFTYDLEDFTTYGLDVSVSDEATVHALQEETNTPLVWEKEYGDGRIVVNNVDMMEKTTRGLYAAQYSLLEDVFAYSVINSSVFFLDDFPAPFPEGWDEHISRHYDMDVGTFFSSVWLPDTMELAEKYDIPFTSVVIVTYSDDTAPPYDASVDRETFTFYGNLMQINGGEIGYHGYNHQPLVLDEFEFSQDLGYNTWASTEDMFDAMNSLVETTEWLFPEENPSVYVPPSNILSEEAREAMPEEAEEIRTIASLYAVTGSEYEQEFTVAEDGVIELPRTVSGLELSEYDRWMALNELNFHFVNSHFFHPDDLLDVERGADKGWNYLKGRFENYLQWLEDTAPGLRKQKASDAAKSIQRYDAATLERTHNENSFVINIDNYFDGLYSLVRIREDVVQTVDGGTLTPLTSEIYLLEATNETVTIYFEE